MEFVNCDSKLSELIPYFEADYNVIKDELSTLIRSDFKLDIVLRQVINPKDVYTISGDVVMELDFITTVGKENSL